MTWYCLGCNAQLIESGGDPTDYNPRRMICPYCKKIMWQERTS